MQKLFVLRNWNIEQGEPIPFKWPTRLRRYLWSVVEKRVTEQEFNPRQYQLQMAHHLSRMPRFLCGDAVGLGKTIDAIIAATWIHDRHPGQKVIIFATKSSTEQWRDEFERFSTLRVRVLEDRYPRRDGKRGQLHGMDARFPQMEDFLAGDEFDVLIVKYSSLKGKRRKMEGQFDENGFPIRGGRERVSPEILRFHAILRPHGANLTLVFDECHKFKSVTSTTRVMVQFFQKPCARVWAMTATAITNSLDEFYSIAAAVGIRPLGTMEEFQEEFCIYRDVFIGQGKVKQALEGYRNVPRFRAALRPFFFGRSQAQVKEPLPRLTTRIHPIDLSAEQARLLLDEIPTGKFKLPPTIVKLASGELEARERDWDNQMTQLAVYQLVANHPVLLDPRDEKFLTPALSPKEEALLDLLDGEYQQESCIVFTKFRTWINRFESLTKAGHFTSRPFLRITGAENEAQRGEARRLFQDPENNQSLIFINAAATEAVNLQQAAHLFCLDLPWSWGQMLQLVGRMIRMASPHAACMLHIFVARGTIDEFAVETLKGKKGLFEAILGESHSAGILDDKELYNLETGMEHVGADTDFHKLLTAHAKAVGMRIFLDGDPLADAQADERYKMSFEKGAKKRKPKPRKVLDDDLDELELRWM